MGKPKYWDKFLALQFTFPYTFVFRGREFQSFNLLAPDLLCKKNCTTKRPISKSGPLWTTDFFIILKSGVVTLQPTVHYVARIDKLTKS